MMEPLDVQKMLREALDPVEARGPLPSSVFSRSRRRRVIYGTLLGGGIILAAISAATIFSSGSQDIDPAAPTSVVPYEHRPLPDEAEPPSLTPGQRSLKPFFVQIPTAVELGDDIRYVIELRNDTDEDVALDPCPAFSSSWGESATAWFESGYLNCAEAPSAVTANSSVHFEMIMPLPDDLDGMKRFAGSLGWWLEDSEGASISAGFDTILGDNIVVVSEGACLEPTQNGAVRNTCEEGPPGPCSRGIEGEGEEATTSYPPPPYFEAFNLWRTKSRTDEAECLTVAAGQQIAEGSPQEGDEPVYEPNGWLMIFGDPRHDDDDPGKVEVPLPRPVRIVHASGRGYRTELFLQSLADCSTVIFRIPDRQFRPNELKPDVPCPIDD